MADAGIDNISIYGGGSFARGGDFHAALRSDDNGKYYDFRDDTAPSSCGSDYGKLAEIRREELTDRGITDPKETYSAVFALGLANRKR